MDGESELLSDTATNCNLASTSETLSDNYQAKLDCLEKKAVHLRVFGGKWRTECLNTGFPLQTLLYAGYSAKRTSVLEDGMLILEKDFKAADIKWSLFVAAAFSFRYESCLRPFPPVFMKNGIKNMDELLSVITDVPALDLVLQQLDDLDNLVNISDIIDLLFYVLVRLKEPNLKTVPQEAHEEILINAHSLLPAPKPQYIFQVVSSNKSGTELKWKELSKDHKVFYGYHGNRLENFYAMINFGLQVHLNKTSLMGKGVCLSPELNISLSHSHGGFGWGASCIGGHLSCVAMCEVIDAPEGINYHKPITNEGDGVYKDDEAKNMSEQNLGGRAVHYIVTNADLIRLRYLLVYAKQPTSMRFPTTSAARGAGGVRQWFAKYKLLSILLGYGLMLATIGFANNQPINYYYKILLKKLEMALNNVKV